MKYQFKIWGAMHVIAVLGLGLFACGVQETPNASEKVQDKTGQESEEASGSIDETVDIAILEQYPDYIFERYDEEYVKAYEPILREACEIFANKDDMPSWGGELSIAYPFYGGDEHIFKCIGFAIQDFSGDGIPELYIGEVEEPENDDEMLNSEFMDCLYTLRDGKPVMVTFGGPRIVYDYLGDNRFFLRASSGAGNQQYGLYTLNPDGTEMICDACYVTDFDDVYFNTTGNELDYDKAVENEEMDAFIENYDHPIDVKLTPFYALVEFRQ